MKILHLYHDLMNLYGEYANVAALQRYLTAEGLTVTVAHASLGDDIPFADHDLIYMGSGTERKAMLALEDLLPRADALRAAYDGGAFILATGNAFEFFGRSITLPDGTEKPGLGWFAFTTTVTDQKRTLGDQICTCTVDGQKAVGFINKSSACFGIDSPLFTVDFGMGNNATDKGEGLVADRFYGTHLTGPCMVKNPKLAMLLVRQLCEKVGATFHVPDLTYETRAYDVTLAALTERFTANK